MSGLARRLRCVAARYLPLIFGVLVLAAASIAAVLDRAEGEPSVPLDDAYIHFQFARSFASLEPFVYTEGSPPVAGATSLLWPALLAPAFWLGVDGTSIVWVAWLLGFASLGLLTHETHELAKPLLSPWLARAAAGMVPAFGGLVWLAASGMEAVPFAWLWLRSFRRLAEWWEGESTSPFAPGAGRELIVLSLVAPLMRPEGALVSLCVALAFLLRTRGRQRWSVAMALSAMVLPRVILWLGTGSSHTTTSQVKWLLHNPYLDAAELLHQITANLRLLHGTLLNGELWSASVLPNGVAPIAACALPVLMLTAYRRDRRVRGLLIALAALGMWLPTTYDSFLWNRLRYLWPFAPAWFIGVGAVCDAFADALARVRPALGRARLLFAAIVLSGLLVKLPTAIDDLAESAHAIQQQQVALGRWARQHLPSDALIGVNDTGAIAYFSERTTFDIVGLTTPGQARHWVAGAGSRFEHYERMLPKALPTHFIVYPEWFQLQPLLGTWLTERSVHASILGGVRMVAHRADYSTLGTGTAPTGAWQLEGRLIDELDVADLVSEAEHGYELLDARAIDNKIFEASGAVDGGRARRTRERFRLRLEPEGRVLVRVNTEKPALLELRADGSRLSLARAMGTGNADGGWEELELRLPSTLGPGSSTLELSVLGPPLAVLHYWSYGATR